MWTRKRFITNVLKSDSSVSEYVVLGNRGPSIIFEAGLGDGLEVWSGIVNQLKDVARVFSYNRAGYGKSNSAHQDRDGRTIVEELHTLLQALNIRPPYILVGHSMGGACMEIFAQRYPLEVRGLVLVDPMTIEMNELCRRDAIREWDYSPFMKVILAILLPRRTKQELRMIDQTLSQARVPPTCSNPFPVVVISAGKFMASSRVQDAWLNSHAILAKRYSSCTHVLSKQSGHYIQKDDPGMVVDHILAMVQAAPTDGEACR